MNNTDTNGQNFFTNVWSWIKTLFTGAKKVEDVVDTVDTAQDFVDFFIDIPKAADQAVYIHTVNVIGICRLGDNYNVVDIGVYSTLEEYVNLCRSEADIMQANALIETLDGGGRFADIVNREHTLTPDDINYAIKYKSDWSYNVRGKQGVHFGRNMLKKGIELLKAAVDQIIS